MFTAELAEKNLKFNSLPLRPKQALGLIESALWG